MAYTITKDTPVIQLHTKTHFPIKLVTTNFPIWQRQVRSTLIGLGLLGYVDGTLPSPPQLVDGAANPCYIIWFRQDQAIVGALLGSCTDTIQPLISNVSTARDAWLNLHSSLASASCGHVLALKSKLGKNPRGNRSINDYLHEMHSIANELALNQSLIAKKDLVVHVLNQLGTEYDPIASAAYIRGSTLSFTELGDILRDFERKLKLTDEATSSIVATAHAAQRHHSHGSRTYGGPVARSSSHSSRPSANQRPQHGALKPFHRHDGMSSSCQFCSISGHDIKVCRKLARLLRDNEMQTVSTPVGQRCREAYIAVPEVSGNPTLAQQRCLVCNIVVGRLNAKLWFSATQARQRCWVHQHRCWAGLARPMVGLVMSLADVKNGFDELSLESQDLEVCAGLDYIKTDSMQF
ncbi:hypothetical protein DM860_014424 [Cuscuta australis]|uniref:Retrotransposon Copia-like N-terminal domain-containing protein n=1 Tax=Cuscuta australis TaxID=267555 RepID=A0A328DV09_9ASTE|nr:hypothetical protein DM860_014424 [Cuscuta australis]